MVQTVRAANIGPVEIFLAIEQNRDILIGIDLLPRKTPNALRKILRPAQRLIHRRDNAETRLALI